MDLSCRGTIEPRGRTPGFPELLRDLLEARRRMWNDVECVSATACKLMAIVPRERRARNTNRRRSRPRRPLPTPRWPGCIGLAAKLHAKPSPVRYTIREHYCITLVETRSVFARKTSINANIGEPDSNRLLDPSLLVTTRYKSAVRLVSMSSYRSFYKLRDKRINASISPLSSG